MATKALFLGGPAVGPECPLDDRMPARDVAGWDATDRPYAAAGLCCCASCADASSACGAGPQTSGGSGAVATCACCFLAPLVVSIAAVAGLHAVVGEVASCIIGVAVWLGVLHVGNLLSQRFCRLGSGDEHC